MKNILILAGIFLCFVCKITQAQNNQRVKDIYSVTATSASISSGLVITYPIDRMVTQRNTSNNATISIAGQYSDFSTSLSQALNADYQILRMPLKENDTNNPPSIVINWTTISANHLGGGEYIFLLNENLQAGWYQLRVRLRKISNNQVVSTKSKLFGVGDVYFIAGQSNASGFEWGNGQFEDNNLQAYNSNYEQMDAVSVFSKSQFGQNSKVFGLPNDTQFAKLIAGDNSTGQVIHPSGRHSWNWGPLGSKIAKDAQVPVMFFNAAQPQSSSTYWTNINGGAAEWVSQKFRSTLQMYGGTLGARGVLWHQGEDDANEQTKSSKTNFCDYTGNLSSIINNSRIAISGSSSNKSLTWFVSQASYYSYQFDVNIQSCGSYCVYNNRNDALVPPYMVPPLNQPNCDVSGLSLTANICSSSSGAKPYNPSLVNAQFSMINATENIKAGIFTDNITNRGACQKIHFNGDALLDVANRWYEKLYPSNQPASTTPIEGNTLTPITVTDLGSSYSLSLPNVAGRKYFWVKNDEGVYDASPSSNSISVNKSNTNNTYICYYSDDNDPDGVTNGWNLRLKASQPFRIPSNTKSLGWSQPTLGFGSSSQTKSVNILSTNVIWNIINVPSWVTSISSTSGGDGTTTISIQVAANTSSNARPSENLIVQEDGGTISQILTLTQDGATGCQNTPLTNLSPTNPSNEWQGWGTMKIGKSITDKTLSVGAYTTTVGIGTHAGSRLVYNLGGQYNTFSGSVGRDDESDNCGCGTMKVRFLIKLDGNNTATFDSQLMGTTDGRKTFNVPVTGVNTLELIVEDGGDNVYGDHADWLDPVLSCGTSTCTIPANPTNAYASSPTISSGQSTQLNVTCSSAGSAGIWSNGASGNTINVSPTTTTTYTVRCKNGTCESVGQQPVLVTVGTNPPPSGLTAGTCYTISSLTNLSNNMQAMGDGSIRRQGATGAANQIWRAEAGSATNQLKFVSAATNQYITVNTSNYADHMYLASSSNNYQSWNIETSGGYYRLSIPAYNTTWDMEGAGGGQYLQNYGNTSEGFNNWRLWRFQATTCPNTNTSGLTNNSCYIIRSVQTNNPLQAMGDGKVQQQSANGQNNQIWKAEASGSQYMFKTMSNNQYIRVNDSNNGTKMEVGAAMTFDIQANGANFRISRNSATWDMEGMGGGVALQNWGTTSEPFYNYRLWSFQNVSCPTTSSNCTNRFVTAGEAVYASTGYGTVNTNLNQAGTAIRIGSSPTTYPNGVGTHAVSEIIYEFGNSHTFSKFKADVGRDYSVYNCGTCGNSQNMVFKVINDNNGQLLAGPVTKTIWESATAMEATITGISRIKLVVEDGGEPWGDWANWANARLECPSVNMRETAIASEEWFWVSPNPNDGKFVAKVNLKTPQSVQLYLSDIKGNIIKEYTFVGVEGMNNFEINIQDKITIESIFNIRCQAGEAFDSKRVVIEK